MLLIPTEVPSAKLREATAAWSFFWLYVTAVATTFVVPRLTQTANLGARTDLVFAGCTLLTLIATYFDCKSDFSLQARLF